MAGIDTDEGDGLEPIIRSFDFNDIDLKKASEDALTGSEWPFVYVITGKRMAYVGETCNFSNRFKQHLGVEERRREMDKITAITNERFNKSATLDVEQYLIRLISADILYTVQNKNAGQSATHNYYDRDTYRRNIRVIWQKLVEMHIASNEFDELINSAFFKYSPYTALTPQQNNICSDILRDINYRLEQHEDATFIINGAAGTGKTVLGMSLLFKLMSSRLPDEIISGNIDEMGTTDEILKFEELDDNRDLRIGFLVPMGSLRKTLMSVMKKTPFGMEHLIIGPNDLAKSYYDILIVDETHRLARYKNLQSRGKFLDSTRKIMPEIADDEEKIREATQLDWVLRRSRIRIMLFDGNQTVRGSDEDPRRIHDKLTQSDAHYKEFWLTSQMRCMGGESYISYISDLLNCRVTEKKEMADGFRFEMFDDVDEMVDTIKKLDAEFGLCRTVAGFGWDWITNAKRKHSDPSAYDINIGRGYRWNGNTDGWVLKMDSVDEIGCVHSTQGFDLNYVGVIFGPEIDYDPDGNSRTFLLCRHHDRCRQDHCLNPFGGPMSNIL